MAAGRKYLRSLKDGFVIGWNELAAEDKDHFEEFNSINPPPEYVKDLPRFLAEQDLLAGKRAAAGRARLQPTEAGKE